MEMAVRSRHDIGKFCSLCSVFTGSTGSESSQSQSMVTYYSISNFFVIKLLLHSRRDPLLPLISPMMMTKWRLISLFLQRLLTRL